MGLGQGPHAVALLAVHPVPAPAEISSNQCRFARRLARWRVGYSKSMVVASQRHLGVFGPPVVALDDPGDDPGLSGCLPGKILRRFSHGCYSVGVLSLSMFWPKFGSEGDPL